MMRNPYEDMLELPRPISKNHAPMARADRAAQFSPFAALTGYEDAVEETARLTDAMRELDEDMRVRLDERLMILLDRITEHPKITITYFVPDSRKDGGCYETCEGTVRKIDTYTRAIVMCDGRRIAVDGIVDLSGEVFDGRE